MSDSAGFALHRPELTGTAQARGRKISALMAKTVKRYVVQTKH